MSELMPPTRPAIDTERETLVKQLQAWLELPMLVLAFIWLALFLVEMVWGLSPFLEAAGLVIWVVFILDFALGLSLSPHRLQFVKSNWLKGIALLAPALRVFRIVTLLRLARLSGAARLARGMRLLRMLSSVNRGMRALGASMGRRGFGYAVVLTLIVTLVGAAGMYTFENNNPRGPGLDSYGAALWWTAMIMTTMGSEFWPQTGEGRVLCLLLALYSFGVFGYVTATLATFFIGRDADDEEAEVAGARSIAALRVEIAALRDEIRGLRK
jgi:voltage-gated potassium channel